MKDYLRNNSKWILAIFSIFLMMAWLVNPSSRDHDAAQAGTPIGTMDGKTITKGATIPAGNALTLAKCLVYRGRSFDEVAKNMILHLDPRNPDLHLFLILTEAKRYGVSISTEEVNAFFSLPVFFDPPVSLNQSSLENIAKRNDTTSGAIRQAVATILTASKFQNLIFPTIDPALPEFQQIVAPSTTNVDPSLPQLQRFLALCTTKLNTQYIVLNNTTPADVPDPTASQIEAQFTAYKSLLPDSSGTRAKVDGHAYPFGYRFPDRVKLEYLAFDHVALRKLPAMQPTIDDFTAARRIYDKDPTFYTNPADPKAIPPTTMPSQQTFDQAKGKIIEQIIDGRIDQTVKQMSELVQTISGRAFKPAVDSEGYHVRIDGVPLSNYSQIADEIQARFGYRPAVVVATASAASQPASAPATGPAPAAQWLSDEQLRKLSGIGASAYVSQGTKFADFNQLALNVRALHPDVDIKKVKAIYRQLQVDVEGPTLVDQDQNTYIYRVTGADAEHDPKAADEVKPQIVEDLRRLAGFQRAVAALPQFVEAAHQSGLAAAALARGMTFNQTGLFTALKAQNFGVERNPVLEPIDPPIPEIGVFPEFAQTVYKVGSSNFMAGQASARASALTAPASAPATASRPASRPATQPSTQTAAASEPATEPAGMYLAKGHPVGSVISEVRLRVYLFEVTLFDPPDSVGFDNNRRVMAGLQILPQGFDPTAMDISTIAARLKFVPITPFDKESESE